jgi:hypothetical protein
MQASGMLNGMETDRLFLGIAIALLWQFCRLFLENHALACAQRNDVSH